MHDVVFHVGLHKTASTWLQNEIFAHLKGINYFDQEYIIKNIVLPSDESFTENISQISSKIDTDKPTVFSSERLSGNPHSGYYDNRILANRIKSIATNAKILLIVRKQESMIVSCYKQYVKSGGCCTIEEYITPVIDGRLPLFDLECLKYERFVSRYVDLFGRDNVLVLPFELLKSNRSDFMSRVGEFLGANLLANEISGDKQNVALNDFQISALRSLNVLGGESSLNPHQTRFYVFARKLVALVKKCGHLLAFRMYHANYFERISGIVGDRYKQSNLALNKYFPHDLDIEY